MNRNLLNVVNNLDIPYSELAKKGFRLKKFLNLNRHQEKAGNYLIGVNVRVDAESENVPFFDFYDDTILFSLQDVGYTIPEFVSKLDFESIYIRCSFDNNEVKCDEIKLHFTEETRDKVPCGDVERSDISSIINCENNGKRSVLYKAIKSLQSKGNSGEYHIYIENRDLDSNQTSSKETFLTNIVFITTEYDSHQYFYSRIKDFLSFVMLLRYRRTLELVEQNRIEARKSAKAAIMSRNMSHNLGSHVMSYLKHDLQSIPTILCKDSDVLKDLLPMLLNNCDKAKEILSKRSEEHIEMPFLLGLGLFIGYLQERQDYIATVSTDYIPHESPVNFKEAVYDELNPDLRYERHKGENSVYMPKNILLDFIAKSEGYARKDEKLKIGFIGYDENGASSVSWGGSEDKTFDLMRKYDINLPGGLVGRQAIFSIMENIIRNSAKHSDREKENTKLEFVFDIIDGTDLGGEEVEKVNSRFASRIHDSDLRKIFISSSDVNNLYIVSVTTNQKVDNDTISFIRKALNQDIIMSDGRMREENKGISEMRISATWLRHLSAETKTSALNEKGEKMYCGDLAPILSVEPTQKGMLRYFFCVSKPLELLVIDDHENHGTSFDSLKKKARESIGWKSVDEENISEFDKSASFIVVGDDDAYIRLRPRLSNRIVLWKETSSIKENSTNDDFLKWICKLHTQISDSEQLYIWDDKTYTNNKDKTIFPGIKCCPTEVVNGDTDYRRYVKYAYRNHHSSEREFISYWANRSDYNPEICIDAITGDNASDRLVRRGVLDARWYCSHIYALKKKIAIFDERLFNMYYNVDESSFFKGVPVVDDFIKQIENKQSIWDFQDELSEFCKCLRNQNHSVVAYELSEALTKEDVLTILKKHLFIYEDQSNTQIKSIFYHEKMINFFTLVQDRENARQFFIMGLISYHIEDRKCIYGKVGTIWIKEDNQICITLSDSIKNRFDYISIHQGLLDKVYALFCKDGLKEKQIELTNLINSKFNTTPRVIGEEGFLENFFIHSGRSKPSEKDMPQKLPFIQYSAIENAVADCKYSLVELFDYARY